MGVRHGRAFSSPTSGRNGGSAFGVKNSFSPSTLIDDASRSLGLMLRQISLVRMSKDLRRLFDLGAMFALEISRGEGNRVRGDVIDLGRLRGCRRMRADFSCNRDKVKQSSPIRSMLSTDSPDVLRLSLEKLTLRRRVGFSRMAEVENGSGRFAERSDSLGVESMGLRARIVEPALTALTLLDGVDVSLIVDLDLSFVSKTSGRNSCVLLRSAA
jgi:hypothetical protein